MAFTLVYTDEAKTQLLALHANQRMQSIYKQVYKALKYLESNPKHPSLQTHEFSSLKGAHGEKVFEAYAQNNTPGAYRIFWHYGPNKGSGEGRIAIISILAIIPHP